MNKSNKLISILICILIVLSAANLFLGAVNSYRIKQLENAPPVVIEKAEATTKEKQTLTFKNETTTTEPVLTTQEQTTENSATTVITTDTSEIKTTEAEAPTTVSEPAQKESSDICYVTASGTKYHRAGCSYLKKSKTQMSISDAKLSGYSPCSRCY